MIFSQPLDKKYTKTPNVFFEEVLCAKETTFNEAKLMGYLIRNTLGYNHKAAWVKVSRSQLLGQAQISYGSINPTIYSCIQKGWILEFKHGGKGKEERYLFLRTPHNERIVHGLEHGEFPLSDLGSLIHFDSEESRSQYGLAQPLRRSTKDTGSSVVHATYSQDKEGCSNLEHLPCTEDEQAPYSTPEHVNKVSAQVYQGVKMPLKTSTKDKSIKDKNKTQQQQNVVVVQNRIMELFNKSVSRKSVESLILLAEQNNLNLDDTIQNTYQYHTKVEACRNVFGALKYALENGEWDMSSQLQSQRPIKPPSRALQRELDRKNKDYSRGESKDPAIIETLARIKQKLATLYEDRPETVME